MTEQQGPATAVAANNRSGAGRAVLGPLTARDVTVLAGALVVFVASLLPIALPFGLRTNLWSLYGLYFVVSGVVLPLAVGVLFAVRRLNPDAKPRVGSLSVDQFASVVASYAAAYFFLNTVAGFSVAYLVGLLGTLAMLCGTVLAQSIPAFAADFAGRAEVPAHVVARDAVPAARRAGAPKPVRALPVGLQGAAQAAAARAGADQAGSDKASAGAAGAAGGLLGRAAGRISHTAGGQIFTPAGQNPSPGSAAGAGTGAGAGAGLGAATAASAGAATGINAPGVGATGTASSTPAGSSAGSSTAAGAASATPDRAGAASAATGANTTAFDAVVGGAATQGSGATAPAADLPAAASGTASAGPAMSGAAASEAASADADAATGGTAASGPATSAMATPGTSTPGTAMPGTAASGTAGSGVATPAPSAGAATPAAGAATAGAAASGPAASANLTDAPATAGTQAVSGVVPQGETPAPLDSQAASAPTALNAAVAEPQPVRESIGATVDPNAPREVEANPFWFAVDRPQNVIDERTRQFVFKLTPGSWILALEDRGDSFLVQDNHGKTGLLLDLVGIERAPESD